MWRLHVFHLINLLVGTIPALIFISSPNASVCHVSLSLRTNDDWCLPFDWAAVGQILIGQAATVQVFTFHPSPVPGDTHTS